MMRRFISIHLAIGLWLAAPVIAAAQPAAQSPPAASQAAQTAPAQTPAAATQPPAAAAPAAAPEVQRSLFEPTWHEFLIGGRFTNIDGDPARYQRYQDERSGLLFSGFRYAVDQPEGNYTFHALADYVGYRDQ